MVIFLKQLNTFNFSGPFNLNYFISLNQYTLKFYKDTE